MVILRAIILHATGIMYWQIINIIAEEICL